MSKQMKDWLADFGISHPWLFGGLLSDETISALIGELEEKNPGLEYRMDPDILAALKKELLGDVRRAAPIGDELAQAIRAAARDAALATSGLGALEMRSGQHGSSENESTFEDENELEHLIAVMNPNLEQIVTLASGLAAIRRVKGEYRVTAPPHEKARMIATAILATEQQYSVVQCRAAEIERARLQLEKRLGLFRRWFGEVGDAQESAEARS